MAAFPNTYRQTYHDRSFVWSVKVDWQLLLKVTPYNLPPKTKDEATLPPGCDSECSQTKPRRWEVSFMISFIFIMTSYQYIFKVLMLSCLRCDPLIRYACYHRHPIVHAGLWSCKYSPPWPLFWQGLQESPSRERFPISLLSPVNQWRQRKLSRRHEHPVTSL